MKNTAYIIIHGFAGSVDEVIYLKEFLINNGLDAYTILLKGHGTTKKDLAKYTYKHWINHALEDILKIKKEYNNICLIGFSMGGLICTNIFNEVGASKLILINCPVYFWNIKLILKNIVSDIKNNKRDNIRFYLNSSFKAPFRSLVNFLIILKRTKKMFCKIRAKTFILQCLDDDTVQSKSAQYIRERIKNSTIKYYDKGGHQVLLSPTKDEVFCDIFNFISF